MWHPLPHMSLTPFTVLVGIALILAVVGLIKPGPLLTIAVILVCVALLIGR